MTILLLCAAHGAVSLPTEAFRGVSHKGSGCSLQPLLHPLPVVAAPTKLCLAVERKSPSQLIFSQCEEHRAAQCRRNPSRCDTPAAGRWRLTMAQPGGCYHMNISMPLPVAHYSLVLHQHLISGPQHEEQVTVYKQTSLSWALYQGNHENK